MTKEKIGVETEPSKDTETLEARAQRLGQTHASTTVALGEDGGKEGAESAKRIDDAVTRSHNELQARAGMDDRTYSTQSEIYYPENFYSDEELVAAGVDPVTYHRTIEYIIAAEERVKTAKVKNDTVGGGAYGSVDHNKSLAYQKKQFVAQSLLSDAVRELNYERDSITRMNLQVDDFRRSQEKVA